MIKAKAQFNLCKNAWEIAIWDRNRDICFTVEFTAHKSKRHELLEMTLLHEDSDAFEVMKALSSALLDMKLHPEDATTAELKATKYHLEDMRTLTLKGQRDR